MPAYNSFSSIAEKEKGLEHLNKFSSKKCGLLLISHFAIPFSWSYFTCSILAFLAHVLPSCHRWVTSLKYKLSLFQPFWLKYCGYLSPVRCFFFLKLLYYLSLHFHHIPVFPHNSHLLCLWGCWVCLLSLATYHPAQDSISTSSAKIHFFSHLDKFTLSGSEPPFSSKSRGSGQSWKQERCTFCLWCCYLSPINSRTLKNTSVAHELPCPSLPFSYHLLIL